MLDPMAMVKSPMLYINGNPYFLEEEAIATKIPPFGSPQGGGDDPSHQH
jgi:hypothetical protein